MFTKDQILRSERYANRRDLLSVLLKDNLLYTIRSVDKLLNTYLKGKVN